jgi:transposase
MGTSDGRIEHVFSSIFIAVCGILLAMADALIAVADLKLLDREALEALLIAEREKRVNSDSEIEHLKLVIAKLQRMIFGRKSEKVTREIEQLELKLEELETHASERIAARTASHPTPRARSTRRPLPEHLPREVHTHLPPEEACPECGGTLHKLGEDVSEILERVPATYKVIRHVRVKMACTRCDVIVQAPAPSRPIERGMAGPTLLVHVLVSKFSDHLPLYRQAEIFAREGIELDRSTLADWVGHASYLLAPLIEATRRHVLAASKIHADDTPIPVLAPGTGKTKTARLWTYVRDDRPAGVDTPPAVWFVYTPDRKGEHPHQHLSAFSGTLQADGYAGFHHLYEGGKIHEAACWAHVRRKFYDIQVATGSTIATEAVERIGALYEIEREIRGKPAATRCEVRQARARSLVDELHRWLNTILTRLSRKSDTAMAIRYALARWRALSRYLDDGSIEIDNSAAERALRAVALGRKNYLFCGSDAGGQAAAAIYSLIGTAELNDIDPERYLKHVFANIADLPISRIHEMLPWNFATPQTNLA